MFKDIATLIYENDTVDANGLLTPTLIETDVFVDVSRVYSAEFYKAMEIGVKVTRVFSLRVEDWEALRVVVNQKEVYPQKVKYNSCTYTIVRTDEKDESMILLICG